MNAILSGKVALVTGGSRGIGFATAKLLEENGAQVVITSLSAKNTKNAVKKLDRAVGFSGDIRKEKDVKSVVKSTVDKFDRIDILVNNAGVFPKPKLLHKITEAEWNKVLDVNLNGSFRFTKHAIPYLRKTSGVVINVSSDAGLKSYEGFHADAYSASKAALILLTKCWAMEYASTGIRVNCVCPGVVESDMTRPYLKTKLDIEMVIKEHPIGRIGKPLDVANAIFYLASSDSDWVTGAVLAIDGGESLK